MVLGLIQPKDQFELSQIFERLPGYVPRLHNRLSQPTDSTPDLQERTSSKGVSNTVTNGRTNTATNGIIQGFFHKSILIALITEIIIK